MAVYSQPAIKLVILSKDNCDWLIGDFLGLSGAAGEKAPGLRNKAQNLLSYTPGKMLDAIQNYRFNIFELHCKTVKGKQCWLLFFHWVINDSSQNFKYAD